MGVGFEWGLFQNSWTYIVAIVLVTQSMLNSNENKKYYIITSIKLQALDHHNIAQK